MKPKISVVIVNWRVRKLLAQCLASIYQQIGASEIEVIVVDNDSHDSSSEMLMAEWPQVKTISLARNKGFAYANNLGIKIARGDLIVLLNPDTVAGENFFSQCQNYMDLNPNVAIAGPQLLNIDGSIQASVRRFPDWRSQVHILLKLKNIFSQEKYLKRYLCSDFDYNRELAVEQIMGAAMIIRRSVFDKIGLFDQKYFVWFEEVDFCQRARQHGLITKFVPDFSVTHYGGASFEQASTLAKQIMFDRSLLRYFFKHQPFWQGLVLFLIMPLNLALTFGYGLYLRVREK